jgi:hypothetical protein
MEDQNKEAAIDPFASAEVADSLEQIALALQSPDWNSFSREDSIMIALVQTLGDISDHLSSIKRSLIRPMDDY